MPKIYKIGTRGSLLALTQCNQVKDQLEKLTGDKFELDVIKTQGDLITNAPLWQLDGKDFFTKELDEALLSGRVDLVVHSYKDLGSERPEGIQLATVTKRTYAHDILLIKKSLISEIKNKKEFIVGTSSPRRMVNLSTSLNEFLPNGKHLTITPKVLRGNVNTRIQKLRDNEFDAIVLALPGIERLALTESSKQELTRLLDGLDFMILPQSTFPSSASQGALGIECSNSRNDQNELLLKLKKMEDQNTFEEVKRERFAFNKYGGGCHLAVGVNVQKIGNYFIHTHKGELNNERISVQYLEGRDLPVFFTTPKVFSGLAKDDLIIKKLPTTGFEISADDNIYVTSKHCLHVVKTSPQSLWAAGTKTMKDLAAMGFWVNGTSDSKGDDELKNILNGKAISIMKNLNSLKVLSHENATSTLGSVVNCYTRQLDRPINDIQNTFKEKVLSYDVYYWTSDFQYNTYLNIFPELKNKIHACGIGKTFSKLQLVNKNILPFSSMEEFKQWTNS